MERDLPFGVLVDALDDHLDHLEPHRLSRLEDGVRVELARVFPSLSALPTTGVAAAQDERYRTHRAIRSLLETLATRPLVVILDDVHWADPASLELIGALLRRPPEGAVLLVLGFRPWQDSERLATEVARAERNGTLARVELEPLARAAADELLGAGVPPALRSALFAESGGVPFYLEQLARSSSAARSGNAADGPVTAAVPPLVLASLSEELAALTGTSRDVPRGRPWRAIRSSRSSRPRRPASPRPRRSRRSTASSTRTSCARPRCRGGSASGIPSSAERSTSRPRARGASRRTSGVRRRSCAGARPRRCGPSTSIPRRSRATMRRPPCSWTRGGGPRTGRRKRRLGGSRAPCGCCPETRLPRRGSRSSSSVPGLSRLSAVCTTAMTRWSRASSSPRTPTPRPGRTSSRSVRGRHVTS